MADDDDDIIQNSATQTLAGLGLLPDIGSAPPAQPSIPPLGLMNPADDADTIIPKDLLRPDESAEVAAAQQAQGGQPVLPGGLPVHPGDDQPGPQGIIPQQLVRPDEAQAANSAPAVPVTPTGPRLDGQPPAPGQAIRQPIPDLPLEDAGAQALAFDRKALQSAGAAASAKSDAETERAQRLTGIDASELRDQDRVMRTDHVLRELADAKATMDTHQWMTKIDDIIRKEPDPGRMFTGEGGGMRRAMWFASILGNAIANRKHPERANMAMQMLMHEIDQDVSLQKDQQSKELSGAKMHLEASQADRTQARADLADDRTQKLLRLGTIARLNRDQAMLPGPKDQQAAKLAASAALDQKMADFGHEYLKESRDSRNKELDRDKDRQLTVIKEQAAMQRTRVEEYGKNSRQVQQQNFDVGPDKEAFEARKEGRDFTNKALLAPVTEQAKADAAVKAKQAPLNEDLGMRQLDPKTGKPAPLIMNDQDRQKAGDIVHVGNEEWMALNRLDKQLETMSPTDFIAGNPKFDSALAEANAIRAKSLHGGGRVSESFVKLAETAETGAKSSWQGKALQDVRGQYDQVRAVVKGRIKEMPQVVPDEVKGLTHNNEKLIWTPPDLGGQESPTPSGKDVNAAYGVPSSADSGRPYSVKEFADIQSGKRQAPPLGPTGDQAVKDAVDAFGWGSKAGEAPAGKLPDQIEELAKAAEARVRKEGHASAYDAGNAPISEDKREDAANRIDLARQQALNAANEHLHAVLATKKPGAVDRFYDFDTFLDAAQKDGGFNVKDTETRNGLRRVYDRLHPDGDDSAIDDKAFDQLLIETSTRYH